MLSQATLLRLETQLEVIPLLLTDATPEAVIARPPSNQWSAFENLAHLARHHDVFLGRLHRILSESAPLLGQYRSEEDPSWPEWSSLTLPEVLTRLHDLRQEITSLVKGLTEAETARVGIHPLFGEMTILRWLEFFLLHEAHHLYLVMIRLGQARSGLRP